MTNEQLVIGIRKGGAEAEKAFHYLYHNEQLQRNMHSVLFRMGAQQQDIPDIIQESLISFYRNIQTGKFRGDSSYVTYIVSICKYNWLNRQKKKSPVVYSNSETSELEPVDEITPESLILRDERYDLDEHILDSLRKCIKELSVGCQTALSMWSQGKSMKEIQKELGLGAATTAATKTDRCRKQLRKIILRQPQLIRYVQNKKG